MLGQAKAEPTATGRGPDHSLVSEYHTLDAGAKENHTAEVCSLSRKARPPLLLLSPLIPIQDPHVSCPSLSQQTQLGHL